jgi:hypothetical protein
MKKVFMTLVVVSLILLMSQACLAAGDTGRYRNIEVKIDGMSKHFVLDSGSGDYYELKSVDDGKDKKYYLMLIPRFNSKDDEYIFIENKVKEKIWKTNPAK